jgi:hemerythrin-like domain-containing protein
MTRTIAIAPPGSAAPGVGYEQPFEMLAACHERVQRMLGLLQRLRAHLATQGADEQARQAARDVMRYFDQAAPQHHLDEERHVFPPLLAAGDAAVVAVVRRLQADHLRMESQWALARALLASVAEGHLAALTREQEQVLADFAALYAGHIEAEEGVAYPAAQAAVDASALQRMSEDMMQRRGVTLKPGPTAGR